MMDVLAWVASREEAEKTKNGKGRGLVDGVDEVVVDVVLGVHRLDGLTIRTEEPGAVGRLEVRI